MEKGLTFSVLRMTVIKAEVLAEMEMLQEPEAVYGLLGQRTNYGMAEFMTSICQKPKNQEQKLNWSETIHISATK